MASLAAAVRTGWMTKAVERWIGSVSQAVRMATSVSSSLPSTSGTQVNKPQTLAAYSTSALDQLVDKQHKDDQRSEETSSTERRKFKKLTKVAGRMLLEVEQRAVAARMVDGRTGPRDIKPGDILQVGAQ